MISIDTYELPAEGGIITINLEKDTISEWSNVAVGQYNWLRVVEQVDISIWLYQIVLDVQPNDTGRGRIVRISAYAGRDAYTFSVNQTYIQSVFAQIENVTPIENIPAEGGTLTVDIYANGGNDELTTYRYLSSVVREISVTHGVNVGGKVITRFVFAVDANTSQEMRMLQIVFVASNGTETDAETLSVIQNGATASEGVISMQDITIDSAAGELSIPVYCSNIDKSTLSVAMGIGWLTSAEIVTQGANVYVHIAFSANTGALRSQSIEVSGVDIYGNIVAGVCTITQQEAQAQSILASWRNGGIIGAGGGEAIIDIAYSPSAGASWSGVPEVVIDSGNVPQGLTFEVDPPKAIYTGGDIAEAQSISFHIERKGSDNVTYRSNVLTLLLTAGGVFPIWRDVFADVYSDGDFVEYEIRSGASILYAGRAFRYPNESSIRINVSRVVAYYLTGSYIDVSVSVEGQSVGDYTFVRDYSYDKEKDYREDVWMNCPINGRVPSGIELSVAKWGAQAGGMLSVTDSGGAVIVNKQMNKGKNEGSWISTSIGEVYTFGDMAYTVVDACRSILLKYLNAYGAFDFFLVEGVSKKTDKITRATYEKDAAAQSIEFEETDYQNTMAAEWQGVTGWLTDEQSRRMKHLVESVEVYMIDAYSGEELPIVMRDSNLEYKERWSNGRKLVNYTLRWNESQKKIRR